MSQNVELEAVKARIRKLLVRTVESGCTEGEAMASAAYAGHLMTQFALSADEVMLRREPCQVTIIRTGYKRYTPALGHMAALARFCDCHTWSTHQHIEGEEELVYELFGTETDSALFQYLHEVIVRATDGAATRFMSTLTIVTNRRGKRVTRDGQTPRKASNEFRRAMTARIASRLFAMDDERRAAAESQAAKEPSRTTAGTSLVVVKTDHIDREFEAYAKRTGLKLRSMTRKKADRNTMAGAAGAAAANAVNLGRPIGHSPVLMIGHG